MARLSYVQAYGIRNAKGEPLTTDTVMYGASLTKMVFAYHVMQLVDQGKLKLDTPIKDDLDIPLTEYGDHSDKKFLGKYGPYKDLASDSRWEKITPRMALTHSTGFNNFWFIEPDQKLRIHFDPGTRFSYSGEGLSLLQFTIEHGRKAQGLGVEVDDLTTATFQQLGMTRTRLMLAAGLRHEPCRRMERQRRAAGTRFTQQGARCRIDGHHHLRHLKVCRSPRARRWPEPGLAQGDDQVSAQDHHGTPVPRLW